MARIDKELEQTILELFKLNELDIVDQNHWFNDTKYSIVKYQDKYYKFFREWQLGQLEVVEVKPVEKTEIQWWLV